MGMLAALRWGEPLVGNLSPPSPPIGGDGGSMQFFLRAFVAIIFEGCVCDFIMLVLLPAPRPHPRQLAGGWLDAE